MTYTPDWESLASALDRMIATGLTESVAQRDLCGAIADGRISVRGHLAADPKLGFPDRVISGADFPIPPRLSPTEIDWRASRPRAQWRLASPHPGEWGTIFASRAFQLMGRTIELIEVRTRDVTTLFRRLGGSADANPTRGLPARAIGPGAKTLAAKEAIAAVWPDGIPVGLTAKDRNNKIAAWARANGRSIPSHRVIERARNQLRTT